MAPYRYISMSYCKKDVTPLLTHRSYVFLALTHWYVNILYIHTQIYIHIFIYTYIWTDSHFPERYLRLYNNLLLLSHYAMAYSLLRVNGTLPKADMGLQITLGLTCRMTFKCGVTANLGTQSLKEVVFAETVFLLWYINGVLVVL